MEKIGISYKLDNSSYEKINRKKPNLHVARRVSHNGRALRNTRNHDRDVEGQVVGVGGGGVRAAENTEAAERGGVRADQLDVAVEANDTRDGAQRSLDRLAHVTENHVGLVGHGGVDGGNEAGRGSYHVA